MARLAASFSRGKPRFKPQQRTLVLCEDEKASLQYLKEAAYHFRSYADIEISHCGNTDPLGIVKTAAKRRPQYDAVYCVIDRDSHHGFDAALDLAARHGVEVIASYPCFEFWLLLHCRYSRAPYMPAGELSSADRLLRALRVEPGMEQYAKCDTAGLFVKLLPQLPAARVRAAQALGEANAVGEFNPSTRLHDLIEWFERLGQLRPAN